MLSVLRALGAAGSIGDVNGVFMEINNLKIDPPAALTPFGDQLRALTDLDDTPRPARGRRRGTAGQRRLAEIAINYAKPPLIGGLAWAQSMHTGQGSGPSH